MANSLEKINASGAEQWERMEKTSKYYLLLQGSENTGYQLPDMNE